jgi:hypothetical protein
MAGRQGNLLLLRKIFPYSDLGIVLIGDNIGFYIVSLVGQVIIKLLDFKSNQLKEIDEICFVLRPEHSIGNKGTFVIKDLRISIY